MLGPNTDRAAIASNNKDVRSGGTWTLNSKLGKINAGPKEETCRGKNKKLCI